MDNQATKHIKAFLMEQQCKLQLIEPHNHRMNAAERVIQTFKDVFIAALATTNSKFLLQLWDKNTRQVQDAHRYATGGKCTYHRGENDIQCKVHVPQSHATCSVTIPSPL
jgi:hypothetical protein